MGRSQPPVVVFLSPQSGKDEYHPLSTNIAGLKFLGFCRFGVIGKRRDASANVHEILFHPPDRHLFRNHGQNPGFLLAATKLHEKIYQDGETHLDRCCHL